MYVYVYIFHKDGLEELILQSLGRHKFLPNL